MASTHPTPQVNPVYEPVPGSNQAAEHIEMTSTPPPQTLSPTELHDGERSLTSTPQPPNIDDLPPGAVAPIPRFYGLALRDDSPKPYARDSYASSLSSSRFDPFKGYDESSIHALNMTSEDVTTSLNRYSSPLSPDTPYRDDPSTSSTTTPGYFPPVRPSVGHPLEEKRAYYGSTPKKPKRRTLIIGGIVAAIIILIIVIAVPVALSRKHGTTASSAISSPGSSGGSPSSAPSGPVVSGGDGSLVTMDDGTTFTYTNPFGGYWYQDPNSPFTNAAKAQSWTPALNETFNYGVDKIRGVNLGGWLVTEPFIVPALFEKYYNTTHPVDEWTLTTSMQAANALGDLEDHYKTFVTEQDFAQIAAAGLNFVRIPLPYWAIEVRPGEPFLANTAWTYFLKAIEWARKYGLRINLDLHTVPGSQNGWNHSGKLGSINFLYGNAGLFNAQRTLEYVRVITEFISQEQYRDVVVMFGVINEPRAAPFIGNDVLSSWYLAAYDVVRNVSGVGQGNGPFISFHNGFSADSDWWGVFPNADRVALDTHPYLAFGSTQSTKPPSGFLATPCQAWGADMNNSMGHFGLTTAGEWSLAVNDCGLWVNGVDLGSRYDGSFAGSSGVGSCDPWNDYTTWSADIKQGLHDLALTSMDALQNYFFWTWKIGNSSVTGKVEAPFWSYQLGLQEGWMPTDPRNSTGACARANVNAVQFDGQLQPWQTGGAGAGQIPSSVTDQFPWPPNAISAAAAVPDLASYTPTGTIPTLAAPTFSFASATVTASIDAGNGWFNAQDTLGGYVEVAGCSYPDPWGGTNIPDPTGPCDGSGNKRDIPQPKPTSPPRL